MGSRDYLKLYSDLGVRVSTETSSEAIAFCPVHNDKEKPSLSFNKESGLYKCFVATCQAFAGGNYERFYKLVKKEDFIPEISATEIEFHHQQLLKHPQMRKWLNEVRGINMDTIVKYKLGTDGHRLWIPIDVKGKYVNVRKHSPNKRDKIKTMSYSAGHGSVRLWPDSSIIPGDSILLCEGELDCLLANQMGFNAVTVTGGAGTWKDEFTTAIKHVSSVNIVYDIDLAGRAGVNLVSRKIVSLGKTIKDVLLPITTPANGDLTDWVVAYQGNAERLKELIENAEVWKEAASDMGPVLVQAAARATDLGRVSDPALLGRRVALRATVMGIDSTPYVAPREIELFCKRVNTLKQCAFCPIAHAGGKVVVNVPEFSQDILRSFDVSEEQQRSHYRKAVGVVPGCPHWEFKVNDSYIIYDVRLIPEINYTTAVDTEYIARQGYIIGAGIKANHTYNLEGTAYASPKDQYLTMLLDKAVPVKDSLDDFKLTDDQIKSLEIFRNETSVKEKMFEIANDISSNVTHIVDREVLVNVIDLAYHSVLSFNFQGRYVTKGRVDVLVIGDTRCGKSETFLGIVNHYMAGEIITGENTSKAGLLGGAQQTGNRWMTTWGKIPMNDRRLLIVDEISGMSTEDIGQLSGVRASGIAEITKIQSERMLARTRAIWAGNPRSNRPLSGYDTGVQAVQELIGRPEDTARFDVAVCLRSGDVPLDRINTTRQQNVPHRFTNKLCNKLVMWAWSRKPENIVFTKEAEQLCLDLATKMSERYSSAIPLVEGAEQRIKLARLSVACAVRLFSTSDGEIVLVKPEHVEYVHSLLEEIYSGPALNYLAYSKVKISEQNLKSDEEVSGAIAVHGQSFIDGLLDHQYIRLTDLEDMLNLDKKEVKPIVHILLRQRALKHYGSFYVKTAAFITLLRKLQLQNHKDPETREVDF